MRFGCRSRYISRYVNLKFGFLPFVVASIVAMVFLRRICSSRPGDGEQRGQSLAALTAHGRGLYCFQPQSRLPAVRLPLTGSSLLGRRARRARFPTCGVIRVAGYSVVWDCDPTPIFPLKSTKRSAATISRPQRSFITFSWCASECSVVGRISNRSSMITLEQTFFNDASEYLFPR